MSAFSRARLACVGRERSTMVLLGVRLVEQPRGPVYTSGPPSPFAARAIVEKFFLTPARPTSTAILPARLASATAAAATSATEASTAAAGTGWLGTRLVDSESAPAELRFVQLRDRALRLLVGSHLDEREPPRPPGHLIADDVHRFHVADSSEKLFEIRFRGFKRQIPDKKLAPHLATSCALSGRARHAGRNDENQPEWRIPLALGEHAG